MNLFIEEEMKNDECSVRRIEELLRRNLILQNILIHVSKEPSKFVVTLIDPGNQSNPPEDQTGRMSLLLASMRILPQ